MKIEDNSEKAVEVNIKAESRCSICSCGQSKSIPYCDESHKEYNEKNGTNYKSVKILNPDKKDIKVRVFCKNWIKRQII